MKKKRGMKKGEMISIIEEGSNHNDPGRDALRLRSLKKERKSYKGQIRARKRRDGGSREERAGARKKAW